MLNLLKKEIKIKVPYYRDGVSAYYRHFLGEKIEVRQISAITSKYTGGPLENKIQKIIHDERILEDMHITDVISKL